MDIYSVASIAATPSRLSSFVFILSSFVCGELSVDSLTPLVLAGFKLQATSLGCLWEDFISCYHPAKRLVHLFQLLVLK